MTENFKTLVRFRWLLYELTARDLTVRYRGSVLGLAWTLLNPLIFMGVYTLVFSIYLRSAIHAYPLFLLSGLIPWLWFSNGLTQASSSIVDGRVYVGKTLMPSELLVFVPVLSSGANFLIAVALLFPVSVFLHVNVGWALLFLPVLVAIQLCMTLGISLIAATLNVFFRDVQQVVGYALTALFFLTPIFYARSSVPPNLQILVTINPFAALLSCYQSVFYEGRPPDLVSMGFAAAFGVAVLAAGLAFFNRAHDSFGEYV